MPLENHPPEQDPQAEGPATATPWRRALSFFDSWLGLWLLLSAVLLVAGWLLPVMTINTLIVFYNEVSILGGIVQLLQTGDYLLFAIVLIFTVIVPIAKLGVAFWAWRRLHLPHGTLPVALRWVEAFGKWSMLDVFVVALLVVVLKISLVSNVTVHLGLYVFAAAVLLSIVTVGRLVALARAAVP